MKKLWAFQIIHFNMIVFACVLCVTLPCLSFSFSLHTLTVFSHSDWLHRSLLGGSDVQSYGALNGTLLEVTHKLPPRQIFLPKYPLSHTHFYLVTFTIFYSACQSLSTALTDMNTERSGHLCTCIHTLCWYVRK